MAPVKPVVDFNEIVQADRRRRKNQIVAQRIFDRARRQNAYNGGPNHRKFGTSPSVASRVDQVGISKRNFSSPNQSRRRGSDVKKGNANTGWTNDNDLQNNNSVGTPRKSPPRGPKMMRSNSQNRIFHNHDSTPSNLNSKFNVVGNAKPSGGLSIRGIAGPYTVIVKNLAVGTTAADIKSAMAPVGGVVLNCRLIVEWPKVIAELILETKEGADSIVETFNNQSADGNILHVYHKVGTISHSEKFPPATPARQAVIPVGPRADLIAERSEDSRSYGGSEFGKSRGRSRDRYRDYEREDIVDGSYGFNNPMDIDDHQDERRVRGLYSDSIIGNKYGRGPHRDTNRRYR